jgi:hypothetical protein
LEKLAIQVIKNVQVKDIHIKYEDDVSHFSFFKLVIKCVFYDTVDLSIYGLPVPNLNLRLVLFLFFF